ncbi:MAG TPA: branched-chain amino acid ABC transporter substrate-binding protein [Candidatus Limnocylindria bacterium]|jgi:branched-chain amino acid transport system substrate-binding protein|nr:branched-chain amino acid ABC transporter substrate-binding protein [Candidatus Limnocylindria bacterium]HEU4864176.1 branched-chain amino acid ABC transporter substrate-binding protein [Candidatus Limnocylindria bacterium]
MQKYMRWSGILVVLMLVLAACSSGGGSSTGASEEPGESAAASDGGNGGTGSAADCDADEFGCIELAEGDPIVIGTAMVITGANESLGLDSQYGAQVAQQMRPEIAGHEVEFNHQDDGCSTEGGTAAARALLSVENIAAVIGTSCSSAGIPAAEILSAEGIMLVSSSNTAPSLTAPETHEPFYARTAHNDSIQGAAMAQFVSEVLGATTAATIDDGSAYADQLAAVFAKSFAEDYGGTITAEEAISVGDTDFSGVLGNIAADSPEFLYFPIFVAEGALITQQARETPGLEDTVLGGADGILSPDWIEAAGDAAEGAVLSGPDLAFSGDFYEAEFLPAYTEISGEDAPISAFHAHAFDAYNMLADAIEAVAFEDGGTTYIPRTALRDAFFATEGFEGITGTLTCDENGDCADAKISVSEVQDGEFVRIWPEN